MTAAVAAASRVTPEERVTLLRNLAQGKSFSYACQVAGLSRHVARGVAMDAGWPDREEVKLTWMTLLRQPAAVPAPRAPEPPAPVPDPALDDHPAVERALSLVRVARDLSPDAVHAVTRDWTVGDLLETAVALAALVPLGVEPDAALAWLDLPAEEWPDPVVRVEWNRWEAGARDATASAAASEAEARGWCS